LRILSPKYEMFTPGFCRIAAAVALIIKSLNEILTGDISFKLFLDSMALSMLISMVT